MVNRSMESDGAFPFCLEGRRVQSQSPVRYSSHMYGDSSSAEFGFGSFVASTPEREFKRLFDIYYVNV